MSTSKETDCADSMKPGKISWAELTTGDPAAAIAYYTGLFGWGTQPFPDSGDDYTMFTHDGVPFAGVMKSPEGVPTHWKSYVVVADIDASIAQSASLGGTLCFGPEEIPTVGRIAIVQDPQGAVIGLHQPV
ncbi:MAG: VOC family protein [Terrimicrobiaceae bacterium]|nr:VOC family protein [Terrimicrobiaceae bacterium]